MKDLIDLAKAGMSRIAILFQMARSSGAYREREKYVMSDIELKKTLDSAQLEVAVNTGKLLIAEHVMAQQAENPRGFKNAFKKQTVYGIYTELCLELADDITNDSAEEIGKNGKKQNSDRNVEIQDNGKHPSSELDAGDKKK